MARVPKRPPSEPDVRREPDVPPEPDGCPTRARCLRSLWSPQMTPPGIEPAAFPGPACGAGTCQLSYGGVVDWAPRRSGEGRTQFGPFPHPESKFKRQNRANPPKLTETLPLLLLLLMALRSLRLLPLLLLLLLLPLHCCYYFTLVTLVTPEVPVTPETRVTLEVPVRCDL